MGTSDVWLEKYLIMNCLKGVHKIWLGRNHRNICQRLIPQNCKLVLKYNKHSSNIMNKTNENGGNTVVLSRPVYKWDISV